MTVDIISGYVCPFLVTIVLTFLGEFKDFKRGDQDEKSMGNAMAAILVALIWFMTFQVGITKVSQLNQPAQTVKGK